MQYLPMSDDADKFLAEAKQLYPERYAATARAHPLISARARRRDRRGKTYEPAEQREPLSERAKQRYRDQRDEREADLREWRLTYALAKEVADQAFI